MADLERLLQSIGKGAFVKNFALFQSYVEGKITKDDAEKVLVKENGDKESSAKTRLSCARRIFNEGLECPALKNVSRSDHISLGEDGHYIIATAQELIKKHC
ncbi:MAG: hypothetical protein ACR2PV_03640 [Gammaproteobacteria bacterium]